MAILVCEICDAKIGTFDPDTISLPLSGDQFGPAEPGFPNPFWLDAGWSELTCSYCHSRAVGWDDAMLEGVRRDRVKTPDGYFIVGQGYQRKAAAPFIHDSSALDAEWQAMEAARLGQTTPADESPDAAPVERVKRAYHFKDKGKKRGR